ncbi:MAG: hypothetical protein EOO05_16980 [Chitinophagaceae bacterium]|nr:MAG: hypothetical protein EOO05_16980 [Chitinophagaceae bacterium]
MDAQYIEQAVLDAAEHARSRDSIGIANERYRLAIKATRDLIWDWDLKTNQVYRDETAVFNVFGISSFRDIEDHASWQRKIHPGDSIRLLRIFSEIRNNPRMEVLEVEYRILGDDGCYRNILDRGLLMRNAAGEPIRMVGAAQNVTDTRVMENALKCSELRTRRAVARATIRGQENERKHLGLELHDNVTQVLAAATLLLDHAISGKDVQKMMGRTRELISSSIQELRILSHRLLPPSARFGLVGALEKLTGDLANTGLMFSTSWNVSEVSLLTTDQQLAVYRIIQEQMNNIVKYAHATNIGVALTVAPHKKQIKVEISDDGVGFDLARKWKGVGLRNIITRADVIGGRVSIRTKPGNGCILKVLFPINTTEQHGSDNNQRPPVNKPALVPAGHRQASAVYHR